MNTKQAKRQLVALFGLVVIVITMTSQSAFAEPEPIVSFSGSIMPYDYADNPILELNGNVISWVPYAKDSHFDIIKDNKEIIKDTTETSYRITSDGCYWIEDESHYRALDSNHVCLSNGVFTQSVFVPNEPPIVVPIDFDNSQYKASFDPNDKLPSYDTLEIVIWASVEKLTHVNACNVGYGNPYDPDRLACYDPNYHRIHISMQTMESLWHELQHAQGIEIPDHP